MKERMEMKKKGKKRRRRRREESSGAKGRVEFDIEMIVGRAADERGNDVPSVSKHKLSERFRLGENGAVFLDFQKEKEKRTSSIVHAGHVTGSIQSRRHKPSTRSTAS